MLFENDFNFIPLDFISKNSKDDLYTTKEGFLRGNMFKNEYKKYKNYEIGNIKPQNEREALLYDIMSLSFALNDLNLYLDLNPYDNEKINLYNKLTEKILAEKSEFTKKYGPLSLNEKMPNDNFSWISNPWPWENERGVKYV